MLDAIKDKILRDEPLTSDEGVALFRHPNLIEVGALANLARERRHGDRVYFNRNLHINPTNICLASCTLCSYSRKRADEPGAFTLSLAEAVGKLRARLDADPGVSEVHIVGGLRDDLPFSYFTDLVAGLKALSPGIAIKAFSAVEIFHFHRVYGEPVEAILRALKAAGLDSLPGGGAEIFAPRVRQRICPNKCDADQWIDVHRTAHRLGIPSNATILFGTLETLEERVEHLLRLRDLQAETKGFLAFIPLPFHPENNALGDRPMPSAAEILRMVAVSRLLLHNLPHLKAYWVSLGLPVAQTALWFGADDFDGTVSEEKIYHQAGSQSPQGLPPTEIARLIAAAGRVPVERNTLYTRLEEVPGGRC
jgi:aminodeoxyfutalosine synthase